MVISQKVIVVSFVVVIAEKFEITLRYYSNIYVQLIHIKESKRFQCYPIRFIQFWFTFKKNRNT